MSARALLSRGALLAGLLAGFWSQGCSTTSPTDAAPTPVPAVAKEPPPGSTPDDVQRLRERAAAYWAARVAADPTKQWELLEPRGRGRMTPAEYAGAPRAVKYLAYQVEDASFNGYFATVKVRLIVLPVLPTASQRAVTPAAVVANDAWVKVAGQWYRSMEQERAGASGGPQ